MNWIKLTSEMLKLDVIIYHVNDAVVYISLILLEDKSLSELGSLKVDEVLHRKRILVHTIQISLAYFKILQNIEKIARPHIPS